MNYIDEVKGFLTDHEYCDDEIIILEEVIRKIVNSNAIHSFEHLFFVFQ